VKVDTILSYCRYNLLIKDMDQQLTPLARCKKIGLINASPLLMGILTEAGPPPWHPAPARTKLVGAKIVELCWRNGVRVADVALRLCLDHDYVSTTLVGMSTIRQVEENIRASACVVTPELIEQIRKMVDPGAGFTWTSGREVNTP
jgi:L-galactose dehydrogenase